MTETGPGGDPPNPFSREGAEAAEELGAQSSPAPAGEPFEPYPPPPGDPYASPGAYSGPSAPGFDPQPIPPYGPEATTSPYGAPAPAYGSNPYEYPSNPYEYAPYQPAYGSTVPYGGMQYGTVQVSHPKAGTAMVFGILGVVFGLSCGIGGLLGIPGILQGRKARDEIDAEPGRYSGRSQAVAGIVTGTIGVVIAGLVIVLGVVLVILGASGQL
jgi:hypothetical protein